MLNIDRKYRNMMYSFCVCVITNSLHMKSGFWSPFVFDIGHKLKAIQAFEPQVSFILILFLFWQISDSKKRKRSTEDKLIDTESKDIRKVSGYRLHLVRLEITSKTVIDDNKQTNCSDVDKHSINKLKQQNQSKNNSDDMDNSDTDLLSMYGNPAHAKKSDQKMTLQSALKFGAW